MVKLFGPSSNLPDLLKSLLTALLRALRMLIIFSAICLKTAAVLVPVF